jgi:predicted GH43/DUF377 family glycosyl hydrolase
MRPTTSRWDGGELLIKPQYPWELVQMGNCGPPIELDEGWLMLTHGVGAMRKYSIGAALLDKNDPSKVIGRSKEPLLAAADQDREGYVPNVVYTCGAIKHGDKLFIPTAWPTARSPSPSCRSARCSRRCERRRGAPRRLPAQR